MNATASRPMEPARWERVKTLFHSALDRPPGERDAFLERACPDDPELLREVESLLRTGRIHT
jgi:eukaryotic-like serine/threonine-protein kinase